MSCQHRKDIQEWARQGNGAAIPPDLEWHAKECEECAAVIVEVLSVRESATALRTHEMSDERAAEMRSAVVDQALGWQVAPASERLVPEAKQRARRVRPLVPLTATAVLGIVVASGGYAALGLLRDQPVAVVPPSISAGTWIAEQGADVERLSFGPDEIATLRRGAAWFSVDRVEPGARFRVLAGDGEVEVRGTRFRCDVEDGRLRSVRVAEGHVIVRLRGEEVAGLGHGQEWFREPDASGEPSEAAEADEPEGHATDDSAGQRETVAQAPRLKASRMTSRVPNRQPPRFGFPDPSAESAIDLAPDDAPEADQRTVADEGPVEDEAPIAEDPPVVGEQPMDDEQLVASALLVDGRFREAWQLYRANRFREAAQSMDALLMERRIDSARKGEIAYWCARAHAQAGNYSASMSRAAQSLRLAPNGWWARDARRLTERRHGP